MQLMNFYIVLRVILVLLVAWGGMTSSLLSIFLLRLESTIIWSGLLLTDLTIGVLT